MVEKHYSDDWAKSKSRDLVGDVIKRTLLRFRKPKDLKVLFFPGIDAQEVFEVYDPLGIPRENLVGIEMEKDIAQAIEGKNLGIQVVNKRLEDYVIERRRLDFDVVSLDYHNPITDTQLSTLVQICIRQNNNHFVLHHANLVKRDRESSLYYTLGYLNAEDTFNKDFIAGKKIHPEYFTGQVQKSAHLFLKIAKGESIKCEKTGSYGALIECQFSASDSNCIEKVLKTTSKKRYDLVLLEAENKLKELFNIEVKLNRQHPLMSLDTSVFSRYSILRLFEHLVLSNIRHELDALGLKEYDNNLLLLLNIALFDACKDEKYFYTKDIETYSYVSESGAPMVGDVHFLSHSYKYHDSVIELKRLFESEKIDELADKIYKFSAERDKFFSPRSIKSLNEKRKNRLFLGSSSRPVLTKQRAIEEFKQGASVEDVLKKYRAIGEKPLAQWKAHVTMGTYESKNEQLVEDNAEDADLEKITKEEAIELISSGIPVDEIIAAYPTSFSAGQLRAFKAHNTMGTYQK